MDRTDLDALLVGSLYGELTPGEQARLDAHLESHPADRTALADMTRAREAVRQSRLLEAQVDPPQSISALLMQEAARRAPKPAPTESWFQRFLKSFVAHPAMAAAATLVLVVGVAGTVWIKNGHAPDVAETATKEDTRAAMGSAAAPPTAAPPAAVAPAEPAPQTAALDRGADTGAYGDNVAVADAAGASADPGAAARAQELHQGVATAAGSGNADGTLQKAGDFKGGYHVQLADENQRPAPMPKDLPAAAPMHHSAPSRDRLPSPRSDLDDATRVGIGGAAPSRDVAKNAVDEAQPPPPPPPAPTTAATPKLSIATAAPPAAQPVTPAPAPGAAEGGAADGALVARADAMFVQLKKYVASGQCNDAARVAHDIQRIAPAYYTKNVQDLRELKSCAPYMRQLDDEERAAHPSPAPAKSESRR